MKVSDYIFDFLTSKKIDMVFLVAGGASAHLLNSIKEKNIKYICNYHEQACSMSAEAYSILTNKPACVLVTNGPGSTNAITGVLGAYQNSIPMIVLSGQVPTKQCISSLNENIKLRQLGIQECDIISMVSTITKYAVQVTDPNTIKFHLENAYEQSTTDRKGPVWLDIPLDIQNSQIDPNALIGLPKHNVSLEFTEYNVDELVNVILSSKRPIIITGNGIHLSETESQFIKLKNILRIPIISTWTSKDLVNHHDDLFVGNFGILGERAANFSVQTSDLLLILGSRLSIPNIGYQSHLFSPKSIKIMVDIDQNELHKPTIKINYPIHDNLKNFFPKLISNLKEKRIPNWSDWGKRTQLWKHKYPTFKLEYKTNTHKINSFYFMELLSEKLNDNDIVVTDMGTSFTCTMQSLQMNGKNRLFTSSACCSMGFGLPGAIGAYYANTEKNIILIAGDGGFQMNIQELQTIVHNKIPIKMFILNNNGYLAISLMQDNLFNKNYVGSNINSGISSPDFCKISNAYGIESIKIENNCQLNDQLDNILKKPTSVLCEIMMTENQLLIPRVQSSKDKNGNIISNSLENMFPYINDNELKEILNFT